MRARHIRKTYPMMPFEIVESELSRELEAYYQALYSYPDHFAKTGVSFQRHLLNVMGVVQAASQSGGPENLMTVS
jgi:hypothetical protein